MRIRNPTIDRWEVKGKIRSIVTKYVIRIPLVSWYLKSLSITGILR